jgi:hypothetical protein
MIDPAGDQEIIKAQKIMKATLEDWIPKILPCPGTRWIPTDGIYAERPPALVTKKQG